MAISDVLAEAIEEIDTYLQRPGVYRDPELRARIVAVRDQADALRRELDAPPLTNPEPDSLPSP